MATREFFDEIADEGSEEDEDFNDEDGEEPSRQRTNGASHPDLNDSSEEEDEDDEEEAAKIREGFIDDDDDEIDEEGRRQRRRERKKRRREETAEDEQLDDEDLDLIGELPDNEGRQPEQNKFKRLKRGHRDDRAAHEARGVEDIFSDEEDGDGLAAAPGRGRGFGLGDEMDDFIEQDEFPDEEQGGMDEDMEIRQPSQRVGFSSIANLRDSGYDEADLEDVRDAFGDGQDFDWALDAERLRLEEEQDPEKALELKDVFEPSQLVERMLTDADNKIRINDVPERFQIARQPYKDPFAGLNEEERKALADEEAGWVGDLMFPRQGLPQDMREAFRQVVGQALHFMNVENLEPVFIFYNRKDYLIHADETAPRPKLGENSKNERLLNLTSLWDVYDSDLKFRAFVEKRDGIKKSIALLKETTPDLSDVVLDELLKEAVSIEELQDIQDYLNFQYGQQIRNISIAEAEVHGTQKRAQGTRNVWDKVRSGNAYHLVRAFGLTADALAQNATKVGRRNYTEDPELQPEDLADTLVQDPEYRTGAEVLTAGKAMYAEEILMSPRLRKYLRKVYFEQVVFDAFRTEKGMKQIDENHPYYEFKYLRNQDLRAFVERPELFLRMLKAEDDGLVEIKVRLSQEKKLNDELQRCVESDAFSSVADAWNALRRETLDSALRKLHRLLAKSCKETLKNECENSIATRCREAFNARLDQAPYKPKGMALGTTPRVFALSNGAGNRADAICWAYVDETGRVHANGKYSDLRLGNEEKYQQDGKDIMPFVEEIERRKPDVIAVSGWSVESRKLFKDLQEIIKKHNLRGTAYEEEDREVTDELEVMMVNDEVARLYHTSQRAATDHPGVPPLARYAIAIAAYMQDPLKEYVALGRDVVSIAFDPSQHLVPEEKLLKYIETAMVDNVNLVGVEINDAIHDKKFANLLPYIAGLGPRKATQMLKIINAGGSEVITRDELVGDTEKGKKQALTPKCFVNAASFLYLLYDRNEPEADYLDNTRIHPEDYEIARKMAADALEFDEEDIAAEVDRDGPTAVVRKLIADDQQDKINDLILEQYAVQLERKFSQLKRATLETIRMELQVPYEELRRNFLHLTTDETFTMLTGETRESLQEGMIVPVSIKKSFSDHIEVRLDCGIEGNISASEFPDEMISAGLEPRQYFSQYQTVRAKLMHLDLHKFTAQLTLRENELQNPFKKQYYHAVDEWDEDQEAKDKRDAKKAASARDGRAQRVIKHPFFKPFNSVQAEAYLVDKARGDCVIRPSSKGLDHLAVTWKVHDGLYQHLDVLELDKENEFSVGKTLRVGKLTYSDLDELIQNHVMAMARKVDEMMGDDRYQSGTKDQTGQWLTTYTEANPRRSMYAFCLNPKYAGYFYLCFKNGQAAPLANWPVKVIPNAYELQGNKYPDMQALKNGFKTLIMNHGASGPKGAMNGRR